MIKVMLVDDHEMVRMGLRTALGLEDDLEVVAEAESGEAALELLQRQSVDVVLMDVMMAGIGGIAACREIKERAGAPKVLMLTSSSDEQAVLSSLVAGANGYLLKNVRRDELLRCLRAAHQGQTTLDPAIADTVTRQLRQLAEGKIRPALGPEAAPGAELSERELEVVGLIAEGKTNKEIAEALIIAEKTARNHVSRILTKLGLTRRSQAAAWAIRARIGDEGL
jgi:DNA-binding NarL/FixJ family response regulator